MLESGIDHVFSDFAGTASQRDWSITLGEFPVFVWFCDWYDDIFLPGGWEGMFGKKRALIAARRAANAFFAEMLEVFVQGPIYTRCFWLYSVFQTKE